MGVNGADDTAAIGIVDTIDAGTAGPFAAATGIESSIKNNGIVNHMCVLGKPCIDEFC